MPRFEDTLTLEENRAGLARCAAELKVEAAKAAAKAPKKHRGMTAEQWQYSAERFARISTASDVALQAHLDRTIVIY